MDVDYISDMICISEGKKNLNTNVYMKKRIFPKKLIFL